MRTIKNAPHIYPDSISSISSSWSAGWCYSLGRFSHARCGLLFNTASRNQMYPKSKSWSGLSTTSGIGYFYAPHNRPN